MACQMNMFCCRSGSWMTWESQSDLVEKERCNRELEWTEMAVLTLNMAELGLYQISHADTEKRMNYRV